MAFGGSLQSKMPLYFFYDCETTAIDVQVDKIIEVAAVIHLAKLKPGARRELQRNDSHEFSSLCFCDREIGEIPQQLIGLTKEDLKDEPPLQDVLKSFFEWIQTSIATASRLDREDYTPVLVAHSGNILDFPMLLKEVDTSQALTRRFKRLNIHFVDTFFVFKDLWRSKPSHRAKLESLSMKNIYQNYFHIPIEGHRALPDARALCRIFSEAEPAKEMAVFAKYTQSREDMKFLNEQLEKFRAASIRPPKAADILAKGITYEMIASEYRRSPRSFRQYLSNHCGIKNPKPELMEHFRRKYK